MRGRKIRLPLRNEDKSQYAQTLLLVNTIKTKINAPQALIKPSFRYNALYTSWCAVHSSWNNATTPSVATNTPSTKMHGGGKTKFAYPSIHGEAAFAQMVVDLGNKWSLKSSQYGVAFTCRREQ